MQEHNSPVSLINIKIIESHDNRFYLVSCQFGLLSQMILNPPSNITMANKINLISII